MANAPRWSAPSALDLSALPSIELTIQAASLTTDNARRDEHLRSADSFDSANHPQIRFVSQYATLDADRLRVRGELHAAGKSISLELEGVIRPDGNELEVDVTTFADHRRLGMTFNRLGVIRSPSKLIVRGRLVRDARGAHRRPPVRVLGAPHDRAPRDLRAHPP